VISLCLLPLSDLSLSPSTLWSPSVSFLSVISLRLLPHSDLPLSPLFSVLYLFISEGRKDPLFEHLVTELCCLPSLYVRQSSRSLTQNTDKAGRCWMNMLKLSFVFFQNIKVWTIMIPPFTQLKSITHTHTHCTQTHLTHPLHTHTHCTHTHFTYIHTHTHFTYKHTHTPTHTHCTHTHTQTYTHRDTHTHRHIHTHTHTRRHTLKGPIVYDLRSNWPRQSQAVKRNGKPI
jgi:hypothetical protein